MVERRITPDSYAINLALPLPDGGQLVVFESFPRPGVVHAEISGREVFRFDATGTPLWQILPEPGTTEGRSHAFDPSLITTESFVNVWRGEADYYASRFSGDTFRLDLKDGHARFSGWARTYAVHKGQQRGSCGVSDQKIQSDRWGRQFS